MKTSYPFRCATGSLIMTPSDPVVLAGAIGRLLPFQRVNDDLEINMVLLVSGETSVLFISFDLLLVGAEITDRAIRLAASSALSPASDILTASHTHFAPAMDSSTP